jgi:hypothetical protein
LRSRCDVSLAETGNERFDGLDHGQPPADDLQRVNETKVPKVVVLGLFVSRDQIGAAKPAMKRGCHNHGCVIAGGGRLTQLAAGGHAL